MMIAVAGGEVWADDSGGDLPPLVLLHPGVGDSRIWEPLLPTLTSRYRVIRYDARGYGRSPAPAARAALANEDFEEEDPPVFDRLGEIAVPTSLLVGDADRPPLIDSNREAAARIPGCELIEVPGVDHLPPLRVPDRVLRQIADTLARVN
jgi:pimeloyl-ACP methyl ester carboxylesterase